MDTQFWFAIVLGGLFIAILGSIAEYMREKDVPKAKGVARDFIIGGVLTSFLFQLIPESFTDLMNMIPAFSMPTMTGGGSSMEPELQVGVPQF